ncbi:MAG: SUMF1/EgtB/PvdO family nonheme iron enzyme [Candidatus Magnetomorum sp.]|nr:SUMF1/EgtB/PvdO family nonheme iron enzyme [Candidatus Magnetomorum sp.]
MYSPIFTQMPFMKRVILCSLVTGLICLSTATIYPCSLGFDGMTYQASDIENDTFSIDLSKTVKQKDIFKIKSEIVQCRTLISRNIRNKQDTLFKLNNDKSKLIGSRNIKDLISRIQTLKKELIDIQKPLNTEINKIPFMGLYAALIESDISRNQESLITAAKQKIAGHAIEKVKTEISSHAVVKNNQMIMDRIYSRSSGEMEIYDKLDDKRTFSVQKTQILYIAVVNVYPLKSSMKNDDRNSITYDGDVVDLLSEGIPYWFKQKMTDLIGSDITREKITLLTEAINTWKDTVDTTNRDSIQTQNRILKKVQNLMQTKKDEIHTAEETLDEARKILKSIYKSLKIKCSNTPESCLDDALTQMDADIQTLVTQYIQERQKEKVQDGKKVPVSGDPAQNMKSVVKDLYRTVKEEYCKREQLMKVSILDKGYMTLNNEQTGYYITKEPDVINIFPYINNRDLHVLLVMGFKIIPSEGGSRNDFKSSWTNSIGMTFVKINSGQFMMGSPDNESGRYNDEKQHRVRLTQNYYMQTTEVTQGQWQVIMGNNPSQFKNCGDRCPVESVSWNDVQDFIKKLNNRDRGRNYRLPTEAEWEYAARAGTRTPFAFGNCLSTSDANYDGNYPLTGCSKGQYRSQTLTVGSLQKNAWGLYDMHGNVWEWCQDWKGDYSTGDVKDPTGPTTGSDRVIRGGRWGSSARRCRSAIRYSRRPEYGYDYLGFRLCAPGR